MICEATTPNQRNQQDQDSFLGMATTRLEERVSCSIGEGTSGGVQFEEGQALNGGGVLFLLPALLAQGLLKTKEVYTWPSKFYYSLESIVLTLSFMALLRIKNPEQLKQCKPGEIGRIIGLDRIPEVKCLRRKIDLLTSQHQATHLNTILIDSWYRGDSSQDAEFLYIDGHVRIYYGGKANLPVKYVSRQKLCLSATTEYWVNDAQGMPVMMVMGELTEKLQTVNMQLCEHGTHLGGYWFREIRRQGETGHQTSIVTTHPTLELPFVAGRMFGRWSQENFFRYLIEDYDFDKMVSFGIEPVDPEKEIVNPQYRKLTHQLKKLREKIQRLQARFFPLIELAIDQPLDDLPQITNKQMEYKEQIDFLKNQEEELINQRSKIKPRLKVCQMPQQERYNKLKTESKLLMNVIRMICYRAESSVAQWIAPYLAKAENEKRMVVKQIIQSCADLTPDYENKTLTVTLHSLSAARFNHATAELTKILNQTETIFPGTDLKMIFEITANLDYVR